MSVPEYGLCAEHHGTVLIVVNKVGNIINEKAFLNIYEKIKEVQFLKVADCGSTRYIKFRYEENYPVENNDWGDFQTFRRVLGFVTIGKCDSDESIEVLTKEHTALLEKYQNSVYDSRCFLFNNDCEDLSDISKSSDDAAASPSSNHSPSIESLKSDVFKDDVEPVPKSHMENEDFSMYSSSPKSDSSENLSDSMPVSDFNSLPTSSNIECTDNRNSPTKNCEASSLPPSPSSSKKLTSCQTSSRNCVVYSGAEAYESLEENVKEFLNSIFWILESKRLDRSFEKQDKPSLLMAPFERKNFVGIDTDTKVYRKRCLGRSKKHVGDLSLQAGLPFESFQLYSSAVDCLKSSQDWLWLAAALEGQCSASHILQQITPSRKDLDNSYVISDISTKESGNEVKASNMKLTSQSKSLPIHLDPTECKNFGKSMLGFEDISNKYEEAIMHYEKYQAAAIVEIECCMKAARVYITYKGYIEASRILQNVVFSSLIQTDDEKVSRFTALASVFTEMGFHRKASFFKRIAAMRCVSVSNPNPNWSKCYYLMIDSLSGYSLPLDVAQFPIDSPCGWPYLQIHMLFDICSVSKMMNNQAISVRHLTFLLQTLVKHFSMEQLQQLWQELEKLTAKCEGAPFALQLENGITMPPVNLINLPSVKMFKLQNLAPHLRPIKRAVNKLKLEESVFIFSPLSRDRDRSTKDFKWVEGDVCEVALQVYNPLPFELKVSHIGLLGDELPFESFPACLSLPANSGPYPVTLLGTPLGSGTLQILGYTTHVLGVKSNCRLSEIPAIKKPFFSIDVIPCLPLIQLSTSFPKASTFSSLEDSSYVVISASSTMYSGERQECAITIMNSGNEPVEWLDISLHSKLKKDVELSFFSWDKEGLIQQLPLFKGSSATFTFSLNAIGDFIFHSNRKVIGKVQSTPVRKHEQSSTECFPSKVVEAVLQFQYSGGPGMKAGYCRQSAIAFTIEVLPSVVITKWDVLPSEIPNHCYLVLDIANGTSTEMEVAYALNKRILIEAHDVCRVPVPVERCPLSLSGICEHLWKYADINVEQRKEELRSACRQHLENLVDLQWILPALEIRGQASISDISWTDDMLDFILLSPIQWDIEVNGKPSIPEFEFSFLAGDLITLTIKLLNISESPLSNLKLSVLGYQDHQNGKHNYKIETKRAIVGRDKLHIDEIKPHEEFCHECGFIFFQSGLYRIDVLCNHHDPITLPFKASSQSSHTEHCLIQKCSPTLALSILED